MKRYVEHGHYRMLEVLKHPSKLGNVLDQQDWAILEKMGLPQIKHLFYKHVSVEEIKELEKLKFRLDNWGAKK
jgi:hypothetical protein